MRPAFSGPFAEQGLMVRDNRIVILLYEIWAQLEPVAY